ncbi:MAG: phosphatidate cytidylyltransferase [Acidobacteria bacterium]|nr:MAG: phosphatidate cytidylyltransferase [Acidobacteriota bacterium]
MGDGRAVARLPEAPPPAGHRRLPEARAEVRRNRSRVTRGDLARRLATAAVGLPLLALALFRAPPMVLVLIVAAAASIGLWEFYSLVRARGIEPLRVTGAFVALLFFLQTVRPALVPAAVLPIAALIVLSVMLTRAGDVPGSVTAAAVTVLGAAYLGGLGGTLAALRQAPYELGGPWVTMLLLTTVMTADSAAMFVGSAIGRHKLAPRVSPGKTWEGLAGALVGGVAGALVIRQLRLPWLPLGHAVALAVAVSLAGTAGDLVESLLKRWAGVKDSGALFPGHGGMLDRLDSLLFGAPVLYYYLLYAR